MLSFKNYICMESIISVYFTKISNNKIFSLDSYHHIFQLFLNTFEFIFSWNNKMLLWNTILQIKLGKKLFRKIPGHKFYSKVLFMKNPAKYIYISILRSIYDSHFCVLLYTAYSFRVQKCNVICYKTLFSNLIFSGYVWDIFYWIKIF